MLTLVETWECRAEVEELEVVLTPFFDVPISNEEKGGKFGESCYQRLDDANKHARSPVQRDLFSA